MRYLRGKQRGAVMKKKRRLFLCCLMTLLMTFVMAVPVGVSAETTEDANADKAIKVEYDGQTYYFDHFGGTISTVTDTTSTDNGLSYWMCKNTKEGETITITLQEDITGIGVYSMDASSSIAEYNPWVISGDDVNDSNLNIPENRTVVLNMNRHTISGSGQTAKTYGLISNMGYLTINGNGTLENLGSKGYVIYSGDKYHKNVSLSLNNATVKQAESPSQASVYVYYGTANSIEECTFINSGSNGAIYIATEASVGTIKNCTFSEGIKTAIYANSASRSVSPMINLIENCTMECSGAGITGRVVSYFNIGTIKDTTIKAAGAQAGGGAISANYIDVIDNCTMEVTEGHISDFYQAETASKVVYVKGGIGKITGDTKLTGNNAIPIASEGKVTIESGVFETNVNIAVWMREYSKEDLTILGGTYIVQGEEKLTVDNEKTDDFPVVSDGSGAVIYPFGKNLDEWPGNEDNTFTLDYDAEKIAEDTAAALTAIENATDDKKTELAQTLQQNINAITDEGMRTTAQTQADTNLKETNGTVKITLINGESSTTIEVANGSIPAIADPQKENYEFNGWYTDEALSTPYEAGEIKNNLTLYAKWEEIHNMTYHAAVAATCEKEGNIEYWSCSVCGNNFEDEAGKTEITGTVIIPALGHNWSGPEWTWTEDYKSATATFTCENDTTHVESLEATVTTGITTPATCADKGKITYTATATFNGKDYTAAQEVDINALGHSWDEPKWVWSEDNKSVTATFTCGNDPSHVEEKIVESTSVTTPATCADKGKITYTATATFNGKDYTAAQEVDINALGHSWDEPKWVWSEDNKSVTATFTCKRDDSHVEKVEADITSETTEPTETEAGKIKYTATVTFDGKDYEDIKTVVLPATGTGTPTDPTNPVDPTDPTDPAEPTNPTDPTNPTNPVDPTDPTNPSDSTVPAEGTEAGSTQNTDANAQTGDEFNMGILLAVMALAGTAAAGTVVIRRRNG